MKGKAFKTQNKQGQWIAVISRLPVSHVDAGTGCISAAGPSPSSKSQALLTSLSREWETVCVRVQSAIFQDRDNVILCPLPLFSFFAEAPVSPSSWNEESLQGTPKAKYEILLLILVLTKIIDPFSNDLSLSFVKYFLSCVLKIVYGEYLIFLCSVSKSRMHIVPI